MSLFRTALVLLGASLFPLMGLADEIGTNGASGEDASEADATGRAAVVAWLEGLSGSNPAAGTPPPKILPVHGMVDRVFPGDRFYAVRFMRYPRAVKPPDSLKLENLVRVRSDGRVERIANLEALKKLFEEKADDIHADEEARDLLNAALRLSEVFYQDGEYRFAHDDVSVAHEGKHVFVSGKSVVTKGGKGEIAATMTIGGPNKLEIHGKVRADVRLR